MITVLALLTVIQGVPATQLAHAEIWFDARASVADFQGRTSVATGTEKWIEVRWRDIDTKNGTRNRHMLRTVEEERFPVIRFDLAGATGDTGAVHLKGTLTLHGVSQPVDWPAEIHSAGDSVTVAADFAVDMRDYGIKPPVRFVIARMGAVVQVHVRLVFRTTASYLKKSASRPTSLSGAAPKSWPPGATPRSTPPSRWCGGHCARPHKNQTRG